MKPYALSLFLCCVLPALTFGLTPAAQAQAGADQTITVTLKVTSAPTQTVLRDLFRGNGKNYTLDQNLAGYVTVDLRGVPFAEALATICAAAVPPVAESEEALGNDVLYHVRALPPVEPAYVTASLAADPQVQQVATANTGFGLRLLGQFRQSSPDRNIFFSPYSVTQALAMTLNGAGGDTAQGIAATLGLDAMPLAGVNAAFGRLRPSLANPDPQVEISVADALWANTGVAFAPDFQSRCQTFYGAQATTLDLHAPAGADTINAWVSKNTRGKITQIVTPADLVKAPSVLTNAVYFHGKWQTPFVKAITINGPFTVSDGSTKMVPMMSQTGLYSYLETPQFQAIALPYGTGRVSFYVFLPTPGSDLDSLTSALDAQAWQQWIGQMKPTRVDLTLPRFKTDFSATLNEPLKTLGMESAFGTGADFTRMGIPEWFIGIVLHKATLEVDEEGTVAAAATAVVGAGLGGRPLIQEPVMHVDHPFLCAIQDNATGTLLFLGNISDPQPQTSENHPAPPGVAAPAGTVFP